MDEPPREPDESAVRRVIAARGSSGQRPPRSAFRRVTGFPPAAELSRTVRAALEELPVVDLGEVLVWPVTADTTDGRVERVLLEWWRHVGPSDPPAQGLTPLLDATTLRAIAPSPEAAPAWVCEAAWRLPADHDVRAVRFTTRDGSTWIDAWMGLPVFFALPDGIRWDDVVDVAVHVGDGSVGIRPDDPELVRSPDRGPVVHCPFTLPEADPLRSER